MPFFECFEYELCGSEICSEIAKLLNIIQVLLHDVINDADLLKRGSGDEIWVYGYDVETKAQTS